MSSGNDFNSDQSIAAGSQRQFATTQWNLVRDVAQADSKVASSALQKLCQTYWYPLYTYVRRQGNDANTAADLTQAFFADLLERQDLKSVDPELGKFRAFLLSALKHFIINQWHKANTQKRGGGRLTLSLDFEEADQRYRHEPHHEETADSIFQRQWVQTLLARVRTQLRKEFEQRGKAHVFDRLQQHLAGRSHESTLAESASQLSMTEVAAKVALHRMRQRFGEVLRSEIAETVSCETEIDAEITQLFEMLKN